MPEVMKELTVQLPESLVESLGGAQKAAEEIAQVAVLSLVRSGKISTGKGAELLRLSRADFLDLMAAYEVPVIDYGSKSFEYELEGLRKLIENTARS